MRRQRGCTAGLSPANSFCGATNQSVLCESESPTCVCHGTAASAHSAGARSKWIAAVRAKHTHCSRPGERLAFNSLKFLV